MAICTRDRTVELGRKDRDYISWPVGGLVDGAVVEASLAQGTWLSLAVAPGQVIGYFAGPDFPVPGTANVVTATVHVEIRVVMGAISVIFDGGYIELVP